MIIEIAFSLVKGKQNQLSKVGKINDRTFKKKNRKTLKTLGNIWLNANLDTHTFIDSFIG